MSAPDLVHKFEDRGLGKAPFRIMGVWQMPSPSLAEANPSAYNNAMANAPRLKGGIGSCAYCGTGITNHFIIKSDDNQIFAVGSDCVQKTNDGKLIDVAKRALREAAKAAKWERERPAREAAQERHRIEYEAEVKRKAEEREQERLKCEKVYRQMPESIWRELDAVSTTNDFYASLRNQLFWNGKVSDRQAHFIAKAVSGARSGSKAYNAIVDVIPTY